MNDSVRDEVIRDRIHIADDVIAMLASIAVSKIASIVPSSMSVGEGLAGFLSKKSPNKGVRVDAQENGVTIELFVTVEYGCKIHVISKQLQEMVRRDIEDMTGLKVLQVNIHVIGISTKDVKDQKTQKEMKELKESRESKELIMSSNAEQNYLDNKDENAIPV